MVHFLPDRVSPIIRPSYVHIVPPSSLHSNPIMIKELYEKYIFIFIQGIQRLFKSFRAEADVQKVKVIVKHVDALVIKVTTELSLINR